MWKLSGVLFELLAMSLGVDRKHYKKFFEDGYSIVRFNFYPPCKNSALTLGTGPHYDPNSLTILHQEQVEGLEVFSNNKWQTIRPRSDALVINIGDTFVVIFEYFSDLCVLTFLHFFLIFLTKKLNIVRVMITMLLYNFINHVTLCA